MRSRPDRERAGARVQHEGAADEQQERRPARCTRAPSRLRQMCCARLPFARYSRSDPGSSRPSSRSRSRAGDDSFTISMPCFQYVSRDSEVSSSPDSDSRAFWPGGIAMMKIAPAATPAISARTLYLLRASMNSATAAPPSSAPREDEASIPMSDETAIASSPRNFHFDKYGRSPTARYVMIGKNTHISIPNSPEFWNQPGLPPLPRSETRIRSTPTSESHAATSLS